MIKPIHINLKVFLYKNLREWKNITEIK